MKKKQIITYLAAVCTAQYRENEKLLKQISESPSPYEIDDLRESAARLGEELAELRQECIENEKKLQAELEAKQHGAPRWLTTVEELENLGDKAMICNEHGEIFIKDSDDDTGQTPWRRFHKDLGFWYSSKKLRQHAPQWIAINEGVQE